MWCWELSQFLGYLRTPVWVLATVWIQLPLMHSGKQHLAAWVLETLPLTRETRMELWASAFGRAQHSWESMDSSKISISITSPSFFLFSSSFCCPNFQRDENKQNLKRGKKGIKEGKWTDKVSSLNIYKNTANGKDIQNLDLPDTKLIYLSH